MGHTLKTTTAAPASEVFGRYYDSDPAWGGGSGSGSDPYFTIEYRCFLDKFLRMNDIRSVVDVGCGDWSFSRLLDLRGISYLGLDVVPNIVAKNNRAFGSDTCKFEVMPESPALVPGADLLVPKFKFALLTNSFRKHGAAHNVDINLGEFRCLDLTAPPFSLNGVYVLEFGSSVWERIRTLLVFGNTSQPMLASP
jgi:hypothetical protein